MDIRSEDNLKLNNTNSQHYKKYKIEPFEYIEKNNLDFFEGNIIKYVTRYKYKNGLNDLLKAKDYLNYLIEKNKIIYQNDN